MQARLITLLLVAGALGVSGCTIQRPAETAVAAAAEQPEAEAETKKSARSAPICRFEKVTGSNMRRRVCLTRAERERMAEEAQALMRKPTPAGPITRDPNRQ